MSLLSIVRDAWARLGVSDALPSAVMTSGDGNVAIMRALAVQEGKELAARATWQRLVKEATFTTVAAEVQPGVIPSDFDRAIPDTIWNYTEREPMLGPLEPQDWQALKAGLVGPPDLYFRIRGGDFLILPAPPAGEDIRFEYVSTWWVDTNADGAADAATFSADTDAPVLSEELVTLGIIWRWLKRNRLPYADEFAEYNTQVNQAIARDGFRTTVSMGGRRADMGARFPRVPDGSWNL